MRVNRTKNRSRPRASRMVESQLFMSVRIIGWLRGRATEPGSRGRTKRVRIGQSRSRARSMPGRVRSVQCDGCTRPGRCILPPAALSRMGFGGSCVLGRQGWSSWCGMNRKPSGGIER
jgi:hypothetical protein